ncbi:N-6 DNA methylase [Curvibacter sp. APW13]|uniref:N-6 DNA methylase n=1 Tax=Curvibacter sp. APW13 TaxID=3077236 RepID=UPI0028DD5BB8|nr:N-6 DNA methylase [Curvibacter sp. APW13]MDT8992847.1 N-6 DNA methylase [Curvibacter sp. APW13]
MRAIAKRRPTADFSTMSLFDAPIAQPQVAVIRVDTSSNDDELPEFDFAAYLQADTATHALHEVVQACLDKPQAEPVAIVRKSLAQQVQVIRNRNNFRFSTSDIPSGTEARIEANIKALEIRKELQLSGALATEEQRKLLARYSGWGGLTGAFLFGSRHHDRLKAVLTEEEIAVVRTGVLTQHFTPDVVVDFIYQALIKLGVKPRRMLDPATGTGIFASRIPDEWKNDVAIYAAEIDPVLASITAHLLPDVTLHASAFQQVKYPDNAFDLVVTNVPFDTTKIYDSETPGQKLSLHNFFIAKALRKVRPGGVVAVVTSTYTLDSKETAVRDMFADSADLIAAARLPDWMFKGTASTEVSSDILIFRRREQHAMRPINPTWVGSGHSDNALINNAMAENDHWWIGQRGLVSTKHGQRWAACCSETEFNELLARWQQALPQGTCSLADMSAREGEHVDRQIQLEHLRKLRVGSFAEHKGCVVEVLAGGDVMQLEHAESKLQRIRAYIRLRDAARKLLLLQAETEDDAPVSSARYELNVRYDAFVAQYGAVGARFNRSVLKNDPDYPLVSALEVFDQEEQTATKSPIMTRRTQRPRQEATTADSPLSGLLLVLNELGRIDLPRIAQLCAQSTDQVEAALQEAGRIYRNPESGAWELAEVYLSGNILKKLEAAEMAAMESPEFTVNVEALKASMPERIPFADIAIQLGSTFVKASHIEDFIDHLMDNVGEKIRAATVHHSPGIARWKVDASGAVFGNDMTKWGTKRISARKLVEKALNMMTPTIRDKVVVEGSERYVVNADETLSAREKLMAIQEEFKTWIGTDEGRVREIEERYNREFNSCRPLHMSGRHLTLPGLSDAITLRDSQKDSTWRNLLGGNSLVGHCVGAGKTLIGICTAMESKRLGIRRCTLLTTPNSVVGQFAREFIWAYPCANLLVIDGVDKQGRERLLARLATGDYDAVIMSHESFKSFGVSEEQLLSAVQPMYASINRQLASASERTLVKELERRKLALDELVEKTLDDAKKCSLTFDQLGCDGLVVDESERVKNLFYTTSMEPIPGLPRAFSARAFDMFVKVRALSASNKERGGVVFMSATPIANSVAEMFHLMRYLIMPTLVEKNLDQFDAWAANFGRTVVNVETTPDGGGFRLQTRFARFENLPELMALFSEFADIQTKEDLKLPVPRIAGGKPTVIAVPPSAALKAYIQSLSMRAEAIHSPDKEVRPHPKVDNMLKVTTDGRKAALDMRMVGGQDEPGSKVNVCVDNIYHIWKQTQAQKLTQLVFCDIGTPGNDRCDIYQDIKNKLMAKGIPEREIAFAHDYETPSKKMLLDSRINRGEIRVTITSTERMGVGRNVQRLLYAMHELDCPWRPDEVEQRGGRIERQGNLNEEILMFRYVTEQSFDAYNWNLIEQKLRFILQVMSSKCAVRSIEDIEVRALTVAEVKALATGNPRIVERALLQQKEAKLTALSRTFYSDQAAARMRAGQARFNITSIQENLEQVLEDVATAAANPDELQIQVGGVRYTEASKAEVADALKAVFADCAARFALWKTSSQVDVPVFEVGSYRGFKLGIGATLTLQGLVYEWCLEGRLRWGTELGSDWDGNFTRIRNLAKRLPNEADKRQERIRMAEKAYEDTMNACEGVFPRAAELQQVRQELAAIEEELGIAELDSQATEVDSGTEVVAEAT